MALAVPTTLVENMELIQYWQETNVASTNPMKKRHMMKPVAFVTAAIEAVHGTVTMRRKAVPYRGPTRSQTVPAEKLQAQEWKRMVGLQ